MVTVNPKSALVVLSGGQDSTTCLFWAKQHFEEIHAITFDYNQRHKIEIEAAKKIAELAGCKTHEVITLGPILKSSSPLVSDAKLEQYKDHASLPGGLEKTFVPMRNQLFLTIAANRAHELGTFNVITGVCEEDYGGYPDCRQVFIDNLQYTCNLSIDDEGKMENAPFVFLAPLMSLTKAKTVRLMLELGEEAWNALAYTHTAYDGAYPPVGHDHATLLRAKGFEEAGLPDPLILRAVSEKLMEMPKSQNYTDYVISQNLKKANAEKVALESKRALTKILAEGEGAPEIAPPATGEDK